MKLNSGLTNTITLCFSLHFPVTYILKNYHLKMMLSMWYVYLRFAGLFVFFRRKPSIKMIYLFLWTWQETKMLYFPCQKAENFLTIALTFQFQSKNWFFQQIFGVVISSPSMGIHLKSNQTTNSWKTTV